MQAQPNGPGLADLPPPLLALIARASASSSDGYIHLVTLNRVCRAMHTALPDAFLAAAAAAAPHSSDEGTAAAAAAAALEEKAFIALAWGVDASLSDGDWGEPPIPNPAMAGLEDDEDASSTSDSTAGSEADSLDLDAVGAAGFPTTKDLTLQLDLDAVGDAVLSGVDVEATLSSLRRLAQRYHAAPRLCLTLEHAGGLLGGQLFVEHAVPLMPKVWHLMVVGPRQLTLPSMWGTPAAAAFASRITHLSLAAHHSGLVPLAAALPTTFPSLTALHLAVDTHTAAAAPLLRRCHTLTVPASPTLRLLLVHFTEVLSRRRIYPDPSDAHMVDGFVEMFTLDVQGAPASLRVLGVHASCWADVEPTQDEEVAPRPLTITGALPAVQHLSATAIRLRATVRRLVVEDLSQAVCPLLSSLVLITGEWEGLPKEAWEDLGSRLALLAGGLRRLEVQYDQWGEEEEEAARSCFGPQDVQKLLGAALPKAEVRVRVQEGPPFWL